jgi:O-antigen/teichoic acid export membrane protein
MTGGRTFRWRHPFRFILKNLKGRIARGSVGTLALKVGNAGLGFVTSVVLARVLGADGFGVYAFVLSWVGILSIIAALGLQQLLAREVAVYVAQRQWALLRGLMRWSTIAVIGSSIAVSCLAVAVSLKYHTTIDESYFPAILAVPFLLPLMTLNQMRQHTLRGLHVITFGQLPDLLLRPLLLLLFICGAWAYLKQQFTAVTALSLAAAAAAVTLGVGTSLLRKVAPPEIKTGLRLYAAKKWLKSAVPLLIVSGMYTVVAYTDVVMVGSLLGAQAVGIYRAASRLAELVGFASMAITAPLGPMVAVLYQSLEIDKLQRLTTKATRALVAFALPMAAILVISGPWLLHLFGPVFTVGKYALWILTIGRIIAAITGPVGMFLIMTGYERDAAVGIGASAIANVVLNAILIPKVGLEGAAVATATTQGAWAIYLSVRFYRRVGVNSTAFGWPIRKLPKIDERSADS